MYKEYHRLTARYPAQIDGALAQTSHHYTTLIAPHSPAHPDNLARHNELCSLMSPRMQSVLPF